VKLTWSLVYFVSARASTGETIQVPHMHMVADIEALFTNDSFEGTKKPGDESRLQNRLYSILEPFELRASSGRCHSVTGTLPEAPANVKHIDENQLSSSLNFTYQWVPSQNGLFFECPHRHSAKCSVEAPSFRCSCSRPTPPCT